jgi:hypothetical protein
MVGFEITPDMTEHDAEGIGMINEALNRLIARRVAHIILGGSLKESELAWTLAMYKEAQLYRVVALATGCASNWNRQDALCAALAARALLETIAVLMDLDLRLSRLLAHSDLNGIRELLLNRALSNRHESLKHVPGVKAVNVMTIIDGIAEKHELGPHLKRYHADLSELCHPNLGGHLGLFGTINPDTPEAIYSSQTRLPILPMVLGAAMSITLAEQVFSSIDKAVLRVAELQQAADPIVASRSD